jgi:hypothetical protein
VTAKSTCALSFLFNLSALLLNYNVCRLGHSWDSVLHLGLHINGSVWLLFANVECVHVGKYQCSYCDRWVPCCKQTFFDLITTISSEICMSVKLFLSEFQGSRQ